MQRRCVLLTYIPIRGGELAEKKPAGWPEWIRASPAKRLTILAKANQHERRRRQPDETLDQSADS